MPEKKEIYLLSLRQSWFGDETQDIALFEDMVEALDIGNAFQEHMKKKPKPPFYKKPPLEVWKKQYEEWVRTNPIKPFVSNRTLEFIIDNSLLTAEVTPRVLNCKHVSSKV